jgi:AcrR family transcriptional regulator
MSRVATNERREHFIKAASKVLREHGVARATTRRIAKEAGAPLASLHYCFRSKEELFEAVLKTLGTQGKVLAAESVNPHMGVSEAVAAILTSSALWISSTVGEQLTDLEFNMWAFRSKKHRNFPTKMYGEWVDFYKTLLMKAEKNDDPRLDLELIARMLLTVIDGLIIQEQYLPNNPPFRPLDALIVMMTRSIKHGDFDLKSMPDGAKKAVETFRLSAPKKTATAGVARSPGKRR